MGGKLKGQKIAKSSNKASALSVESDRDGAGADFHRKPPSFLMEAINQGGVEGQC